MKYTRTTASIGMIAAHLLRIQFVFGDMTGIFATICAAAIPNTKITQYPQSGAKKYKNAKNAGNAMKLDILLRRTSAVTGSKR